MDQEIESQILKTGTLPVFLITITPLSKVLAMIVFILFPFVGFCLGYEYALKSFTPPKPLVIYIQITPTPTATPTVPTVTPVKSGIKNGSQIWADIIEGKIVGNSVHLIIDYLETNPCWTPGGPSKPGCPNGGDNNFYLNKVPEQIEIPLSANAKLYNCDGAAPDTTPLDAHSHQDQIAGDYYLNISHNQITALYQRCLP